MEVTTTRDKGLKQMVDTYLLACQVEGKSPNTIRAYRETLVMFLGIAEEEGFPTEVCSITPNHVYTYLGRIMERGVTPETRHRRHREVRFFFSWLVRMDYIRNHPFAKIKNLRLGDKIVQPFSQQDVATLLQAKFLTCGGTKIHL
jgi:site-specific recombinase XerD